MDAICERYIGKNTIQIYQPEFLEERSHFYRRKSFLGIPYFTESELDTKSGENPRIKTREIITPLSRAYRELNVKYNKLKTKSKTA